MRTRGLIVLILLSGCVLVCELQPQGSITQFHYVNLEKTWAEAQSYCREKFIDLASIPSQAANTEAQQEVVGDRQVWIGLYNGSWKWSQDGKQVQSWVLHLVMGESGSGKCGMLYRYSRWRVRSCETQGHFICSTADYKHVLVKQQMSWSDAQTFCRKNHVDLGSIKSASDRNNMVNLLANADTNEAWIGLYRDEWVWSDGKKHTLWKTPFAWTSDCIMMNPSTGTWSSRFCQERRAFLCYSVVKPLAVSMVRVRLMGGSAELTDPTVQESILQQLRQQLVDGGITEEVKLRWRKQPDGEVFHREEETPADHQKETCRKL